MQNRCFVAVNSNNGNGMSQTHKSNAKPAKVHKFYASAIFNESINCFICSETHWWGCENEWIEKEWSVGESLHHVLKSEKKVQLLKGKINIFEKKVHVEQPALHTIYRNFCFWSHLAQIHVYMYLQGTNLLHFFLFLVF